MAKEMPYKRHNAILKIMSGVAGVALVGCIAAGPLAQPAEAMSTDGYVTAAATRAAGPAPEILGLTGVEESGQFVTLVSNVPQYDWTQPKYYLLGNTSYNTAANPYFVNAADSNQSGDSVVYNASRAGGGTGPNSSLAAYGEDETDDAVWELLPDVIVGNGGTTDYATSAASVASGYSPAVVSYSFSDYSDMIDLMYELAEAGDDAVTDSKSLRYDDSATTIATKYEAYIRGTQGYILSQLDEDEKEKKTVVSIADYDKDEGTFTLRLSDTAEGTASENRYLETCEVVADNYADSLVDPNDTAAETVTISADDLKKANVDLVLIGGQQGSSTATQDDILDALKDCGYTAAKGNVYYVTDSTAGSAYGVIMNSVENAQNIGRILGVLYPEYVDQDQFVAYYYENFYHITTGENNATLAYVMNRAMDGVYNYDYNLNAALDDDDASGDDPYTKWSNADGADYDESAVLAKINAGLDYIRSLDNAAPDALQLSDYLSEDDTDIEE